MINYHLNEDTLEDFKSKFFGDPSNVVALNACSRLEPFEVCISRARVQQTQHVFSHKVDLEGKPVTDQKNTGRCWIFAALNVIRIPFMKQHNLEEFEFSQAYLFFWDKIERCNYFLNTMVETFRRGEEVDGRLVSLLLSEPLNDGGQWDMLVNLVNKYGLIPKKYFPETYSSEASSQLNSMLHSKLREYALVLRGMMSQGSGDDDLVKKIKEQMRSIYRIVAICLGVPPTNFTWEYYDKSKQYKREGPITPFQFYNKFVKPYYNVDDKICLVSDPRPSNLYGKLYTIDCLGNMVGGRLIKYNNQPIEVLTTAAANSIKNNESVWFGSEVSKRFSGKLGFQDLQIHDYKAVFGSDISLGMSKAERMIYGESKMTHAMAITGVNYNEKDEPVKWRVENSWGDERGDKGYLLMTTDWFKEYVYEVVIDKKYVPQSVLDVYNQVPIVLPLWDPMGVVAD